MQELLEVKDWSFLPMPFVEYVENELMDLNDDELNEIDAQELVDEWLEGTLEFASDEYAEEVREEAEQYDYASYIKEKIDIRLDK